jgi:Icc protein
MKRFVWYSDTHLNLSALPFMKRWFVTHLNRANPDGVFITGDISSGLGLEGDLRFLARHYNKDIYFVLGNHDYHKRHIQSVHADIRRLCSEYPNLHWMTEEPIVTLAEDVALIGTEGWYDAALGNPRLLRWTSDWYLTFDFLGLPNMDERIAMWREMARDSADLIAQRLELALENHKTVYVMTHFPPWKEATRAEGTWFEKYWLPYNTNVVMGKAIERVMEGRKKKRAIVLAGHTHTPCHIRVTNSIQCMVARASYWGRVRPEETIVV